MEYPELIGAALMGAAAAAGIVYGAIRTRVEVEGSDLAKEAEERAERAEAIAIKDEIIASLRELNDELRGQIEAALAREDEWRAERAEFKEKLARLGEAYDVLVEAIVNANLCALAESCARRVLPGQQASPR